MLVLSIFTTTKIFPRWIKQNLVAQTSLPGPLTEIDKFAIFFHLICFLRDILPHHHSCLRCIGNQEGEIKFINIQKVYFSQMIL